MGEQQTLQMTLKPNNEQFITNRILTEYDTVGWREYRADHPRRGRAVIANFMFKVDEKLKGSERDFERKGSEKDVGFLKETFGTKIGFDVVEWQVEGLTSKEFMVKVREEAALSIHERGDCFVMFIMTHGGNGGSLRTSSSPSQEFNIQDVVNCFKGDNCPSLRGKPKIFIVQSCRGREGQASVWISKSPASPLREMITIPTQADILVAYSQCEGFYSLRSKEEGSYFIRSLCHALNVDHEKPDEKKDDILTLLTFTSHIVSCFEFWETKSLKSSGCGQEQMTDGAGDDGGNSEVNLSCSDQSSVAVDAFPFNTMETKMVKQQPTKLSTLRKLLFFRKKDIMTEVDKSK